MEQVLEAVVDVTVDNIQQVVGASNQVVVALSFFAQHRPESQAMNQLLHTMTQRYQGQLTLAQVDCDAQPQMAQYFQVQSLPAVILLQNGQTIDGFFGDKTEAELDTLLQKYLPEAWKIKWQQAIDKQQQGDLDGAILLLKEAFLESPQPDLGLALFDTLLQAQALDDAQHWIDHAQSVLSGEQLAACQAQLDEALANTETPALKQLAQAHADQPDDLTVLLAYAKALAGASRVQQALELMWQPLALDINAAEGEMKADFLNLLNTLAATDAVARSYRQKLYGLMH